MRAVVLQGERSVTVTDMPDAELPSPDGIVVRVERAAICGSDLHLYHATSGFDGVRLGHEFIGTVTDAGPEVRTVRTGDRVLVSGVIGCGRCVACLARDPVVCRRGPPRIFGTSLDLHGGQAEAVGVPAADASVIAIPPDISDESAVLLTDILPTGWLGAAAADIRPGSTVLVIGAGPVGLMALRCARLFSPGRLIVADTLAARRAGAERLGAEAIDPGDGGTMDQVLERTGGRGADAVIEAVGGDQTVMDALLCAAPGSTVSIIGVSFNLALPIPMILALHKRLTIKPQLASIPSTWETLVPLVANGAIEADDVFSHRMGLSETAEAYRMFDARTDDTLKVLLDPSG